MLVMKQSIGISMGTDPALFLENLNLYFLEESMPSLTYSDKMKAAHFQSTKPFNDELCPINNGENSGRSICQKKKKNQLQLKV